MAPKVSKKEREAAEAKRLAERQKAAEEAFNYADKDGSGAVDDTELTVLLKNMLQRESITVEANTVEEFVKKEFSQADEDGSGDVDFDEFIEYYNKLIDRITEGELNKALAEAKKQAEIKAEEAAIAEDDEVYIALHALLTVLSAPSIKTYSGLVLPFKIRGGAEYDTPNAEHGATSRGIVLDLSRRAQRLLTPWGSFPIGYRLAFPGYQDKMPPPEEEEEKSPNPKLKKKKTGAPWPLIPAAPTEDDYNSMFFHLAKTRLEGGGMMVVRKLPGRCHFAVCELLGVKVPRGEVLALSNRPEVFSKLKGRWDTMLKKYARDPRPDQLVGHNKTVTMCTDENEPVVNTLLAMTVVYDPNKLEALKKKKEVAQRAANKRFPEEDLHYALKMKNNDTAEAAKLLVKMSSDVNNTLDKRQGHSTRAGVRYALQTCEWNEEDALWMLKNQDKLVKQKYDLIFEKLGTENGLGYPTKMELERKIVKTKGEEGKVMAELKRQWKTEIEFMVEIVAAAEVEEMLTPEQCEKFAFTRPTLTAEEAKHAEDLYLSDEFGRDKEKVNAFLTACGVVMTKCFPKPERAEVEELLRELNTEPERVMAFLSALQNMSDLAPKQGGATREDCARHLKDCDRNEEWGTELLKQIWKIANPKPPKPPPKGSKKPPQEHLYAKCGGTVGPMGGTALEGGPSRTESEWALLSTRAANKDGKPLDVNKAVELLMRLDSIYQERSKYPGITRDDIVWSLDIPRGERFIKVRPIEHDEYKAGESPTSIMLKGISHLHMKGEETGVRTGRKEMLESLEKFKFNRLEAEKWLNGVGTLMTRQAELGIASREEVETELAYHNLDDAKVIQLFAEVAQLQAKRAEIGNCSRDEIKAMLTLAWEAPDRVNLSQACLATYCELIADEANLILIFGERGPSADDKAYMRVSILGFKGDAEPSKEFLLKVAEVVGKGDALGNPSRDYVVAELAKAGGDKRKASSAIREEYHRVRDLELKAEYAKNKEKQNAKKETK